MVRAACLEAQCPKGRLSCPQWRPTCPISSGSAFESQPSYHFYTFFFLSRPESRSHMCLTARRNCYDSVFCNVLWWDGASRDSTMSSRVYRSLQGRKYGR